MGDSAVTRIVLVLDPELHDRAMRADARLLATASAGGGSVHDRLRAALVQVCAEIETSIGDDPQPPLDLRAVSMTWNVALGRWAFDKLMERRWFARAVREANLDTSDVRAAGVAECISDAALHVAALALFGGLRRRSAQQVVDALPCFLRALDEAA